MSLDECVNEVCPWSGRPVSADALTQFEGNVVGFCNPGCRDRFNAGHGDVEKAVVAFRAAAQRNQRV